MQAFFAYVIKREKLEHLVTTRMIEGKHSSRKQQEKMLDGLAKRLNVRRVTCTKSNQGSRCVEGDDSLAGYLIDGGIQ